MKKYFVLLLAVLLVGGLFAVKITMTSGGVGKELEVLKKQLEMFHQQYPDIEVEIIPMPDSSTERHDLYVTYFAARRDGSRRSHARCDMAC